MAEKPFKVIVVGGGPVGLVAAHALAKAGIDFIVLESKKDIVHDVGASVVIGPNNLRVMHQLGLYNTLMRIGSRLERNESFLLNGYRFKQNTDLLVLANSHGIGHFAFHRAQLVQTLYGNLPDEAKNRYLRNKRVWDIETHDTGVRVICQGNEIFEGSIVIGADGAHSITRQIMRRLAATENPEAAQSEDNPFPAEYRCMWCSFPAPESSGANYEATSKDKSAMFLTGKDRGWILLYDKFATPTTERHRYTDEDVEAFAANLAEFPVTESLKVKDVFAKRLTWGMSDLGEGVLENWHWKRIVLAGDSCHKFTPNAGLGFNNGIQDIVVLSNKLHDLIKEEGEEVVNTEALDRVFRAYQQIRLGPAQADFKYSANVTRMQTWATWTHYLLSRFAFSWNFISSLLRTYVASPAIRKGFVLDFVLGTTMPAGGTISWENTLP